MEDCACCRMGVCAWFTAYLRGVTLMLEPSSKFATCFVKPCGPTTSMSDALPGACSRSDNRPPHLELCCKCVPNNGLQASLSPCALGAGVLMLQRNFSRLSRAADLMPAYEIALAVHSHGHKLPGSYCRPS